MRSLAPIVYWADYGFPVTARYDLVSQILRDRRFGRDVTHIKSAAALGWEPPAEHVRRFYQFEANSMLEREPPVHTRLRGLVNRAFVSRAIEQLRPRIARLCNDLIDGFAERGQADLLSVYATPVPVLVIADLLGLAAGDVGMMLEWSHRMVAMYQFGRTRDDEDAAVAAMDAFSAYVRDHVRDRRNRPGADLISLLIAARDQGDRLSDDELVGTIILLMNAGHEATVHSLGNALAILLETKRSDPPGWRALQAMLQSSDGTRAIVEETLRFDPPLHLFTRYALETVELEGQTFDVGDKIGLLLAAANRDPTVYDLQDDFDPSRYLRKEPAAQPLSFGAGIHFCLGASLARIELQIAIPTLLQRLPDIRLAGTPTYRDSYHFHGLAMLDVRWQ
jgi:cytochrome P450